MGRVCATGMYRSNGHVEFPKFQTGIFVEWKGAVKTEALINIHGFQGGIVFFSFSLNLVPVPRNGNQIVRLASLDLNAN